MKADAEVSSPDFLYGWYVDAVLLKIALRPNTFWHSNPSVLTLFMLINATVTLILSEKLDGAAIDYNLSRQRKHIKMSAMILLSQFVILSLAAKACAMILATSNEETKKSINQQKISAYNFNTLGSCSSWTQKGCPIINTYIVKVLVPQKLLLRLAKICCCSLFGEAHFIVFHLC